MGAAQFALHPNYAALILRKSFADLALPGAVMARSHEWWGGTAARWDGTEHIWTFPSGAKIAFGYLEDANDKYRYQSAEFQYVAFDELTQFREIDYRYLNSRLRRLAGSEIPIRLRGATNPGGFGHDWVLQHWKLAKDGLGHDPERPFIPATLKDNPSIDEAEYLKSLAELDPYTRQQLLDGNWFARPPGSKFRREWFEIVDDAPVEAERIRWWDLAATEEPHKRPGSKLTSDDPDYTVGLLLARTARGIYYIEDVVRGRWKPHDQERVIAQTARRDAGKYGVLGFEIWMEQEPGSSGIIAVEHYRLMLDGYTFRHQPSTGKKEIRANPVSAAAGAHNLKLVYGPWVSDYLNEAEQFPDPSVHDDQIDATSGPFNILARRGAVSEDDWAMGVWRCPRCKHGFKWEPNRACPQCQLKAPDEYPQPFHGHSNEEEPDARAADMVMLT
jgi:predicted phage terminase large subunit-like protein